MRHKWTTITVFLINGRCAAHFLCYVLPALFCQIIKVNASLNKVLLSSSYKSVYFYQSRNVTSFRFVLILFFTCGLTGYSEIFANLVARKIIEMSIVKVIKLYFSKCQVIYIFANIISISLAGLLFKLSTVICLHNLSTSYVIYYFVLPSRLGAGEMSGNCSIMACT